MSQGNRLGHLGAAFIGAMWLGVPALAQTLRPAAPPAAPPRSATAPVAKTFVREGLASAGVRLETALKSEAPPGAKTAAQWRREAETAARTEGAEPDAELNAYAAAVAADPNDVRNWLDYANAAIAAGNDEERADYSARFKLKGRASAAAYQGYLRARNLADEARALSRLG